MVHGTLQGRKIHLQKCLDSLHCGVIQSSSPLLQIVFPHMARPQHTIFWCHIISLLFGGELDYSGLANALSSDFNIIIWIFFQNSGMTYSFERKLKTNMDAMDVLRTLCCPEILCNYCLFFCFFRGAKKSCYQYSERPFLHRSCIREASLTKFNKILHCARYWWWKILMSNEELHVKLTELFQSKSA